VWRDAEVAHAGVVGEYDLDERGSILRATLLIEDMRNRLGGRGSARERLADGRIEGPRALAVE
jgi:hypothetical protein